MTIRWTLLNLKYPFIPIALGAILSTSTTGCYNSNQLNLCNEVRSAENDNFRDPPTALIGKWQARTNRDSTLSIEFKQDAMIINYRSTQHPIDTNTSFVDWLLDAHQNNSSTLCFNSDSISILVSDKYIRQTGPNPHYTPILSSQLIKYVIDGDAMTIIYNKETLKDCSYALFESLNLKREGS